MYITYVKKLRRDGSACRKCQDVERRLKASGYFDLIDEVVIADERDSASAGMRLADRWRVDRAPFFVVEKNGAIEIYTIYFKFVREVMEANGMGHGDLQLPHCA